MARKSSFLKAVGSTNNFVWTHDGSATESIVYFFPNSSLQRYLQKYNHEKSVGVKDKNCLEVTSKILCLNARCLARLHCSATQLSFAYKLTSFQLAHKLSTGSQGLSLFCRCLVYPVPRTKRAPIFQ